VSQTSTEGRAGAHVAPTPSFLKVAKYTINGGKTIQGNPVFASNTTVILDGPPLLSGDLILQVVTDCREAFSDADDGDDTTLNIRFNDGSTQTDIQAAASIGGNPFDAVRQDLMVQDLATEGDWLKLTLTTRVEVVVQDAQDIDSGLMDIYVLYVSPVG
jgi:hypothetical protein